MIRLRKFSLNFFFRLLTVTGFLTVTCNLAAQSVPAKQIGNPLTDTIRPRAMNAIKDTVPARVIITADTVLPSADTIPTEGDSLIVHTDTFNLKLSKDSLDAPVKYYAEDSAVVHIRSKRIILYGKTQTEYNRITLTAPTVEIDQATQVITALNSKDSTGEVSEYAKFKDGEQEFQSDTIRYNFKTQRGLTRNTITQSDQLYVHGERVKKMDKDVTFVDRGFFTTCNLDVPHFGFRANKLKVVSKKTAISGPVHPEFEGVPVPVYVPFGYFPLSQGRKSGLLAPQFATNDQMGLGLEGLGYYKVISDYWDVKLYGNVYSYGTWMANINPTYRKRYRYAGSFNFGMQKTKRNFKGDPDYSSINTYNLTWSHSTDSRARPGTSFSANVNASSTRYNENVTNDPMLNYSNTGTSSITYSKTWVDKPYNLTVSANHQQNNIRREVTVKLPDVAFTVSTVYPFQQKEPVGPRKWYEQLGIGYQGTASNEVTFYDTAFSLQQLSDNLNWGATHRIPITLALPAILNGAVVVSPSISYSQVWVSRETFREWRNDSLVAVTRKAFNIDQQMSTGLSFNTALYGTYQFKNSKVVAIRHVIRPTFGFSYSPDLSAKYYDNIQVDSFGTKQWFSRLNAPVSSEAGLTQGFGRGESGSINFGLDNNLEMKVRNTKDTTGENAYRKIRLIDGFGFNGSYNFLADEFKLSPISLYFRNNLFDKININANASLNPYKIDTVTGFRVDEYVWKSGFKLGKITNASLSLSTSFQSKPKDEAKAKQREAEVNQQLSDPVLAADRARLLDYMQQNPSEFVDFNIPWQFSLSYTLQYNSGYNTNLGRFENDLTSGATFSGSFSLTPKWNFTTSGFVDVNSRKLENINFSINREMHCWQMSINVTPIGYIRSFSFTISPKSGILQDLRINRNRSFYTRR